MADFKTLKKIQSRLRTRKHDASYQEIRDAIASQEIKADTLTSEEITKVMNTFLQSDDQPKNNGIAVIPQQEQPDVAITVKNETAVTLTEEQEKVFAVSEPLAITTQMEFDPASNFQIKENFNQQPEERGEIQLIGQEKLDFIQKTADRAGLQLAKVEIAEIAESAPSSFQTRRQMIGEVLSSIQQYLADEENYFASELQSIGDRVTQSDRTVAARVSEVLQTTNQSATDFKSLADKLNSSFRKLNGKD
jgi:hypothetical protein